MRNDVSRGPLLLGVPVHAAWFPTKFLSLAHPEACAPIGMFLRVAGETRTVPGTWSAHSMGMVLNLL